MEAIVSSKGKIVIPRKIREALGITAGTSVDFSVRENIIEMRVIHNSARNQYACPLLHY